MEPFVWFVVAAFSAFIVVLASIAWWSDLPARPKRQKPHAAATPVHTSLQASRSMSQ